MSRKIQRSAEQLVQQFRLQFDAPCAGCGKNLKGELLTDLRPLADGSWVHYGVLRMVCWWTAAQRPIPGQSASKLSTSRSGVENPLVTTSRGERRENVRGRSS